MNFLGKELETLPVRLHDTSDYRRSMFLPQAHKYGDGDRC